MLYIKCSLTHIYINENNMIYINENNMIYINIHASYKMCGANTVLVRKIYVYYTSYNL